MEEFSGSGRRPPQPPRKELQGPRPTPLKVRKDSHKIKKPPPAPAPPRPPVIIYSVSPKVIHTSPRGFMDLVQRLTGPDNNNNNNTATSSAPPPSPAARLASIEKTKMPPSRSTTTVIDLDTPTGLEHFSGARPGLLSPGPSGLTRPVPAAFFADPFSPLMSLYHQHQNDHLSTLQHLQNGVGVGNLTPTAAMLLSPSPMLSPASIEFLTRLLDQ